jgi:Uma2 family endonuclease
MSSLTQTPTSDRSETPCDEIIVEKKVWTDEEFMALSRDRHRFEIVNGELVDRDKLGAKHSYIAFMLIYALFAVVRSQKLGALFNSSTAFKMKNGNKRASDISFFAKERLQGMEDLPDGFLEGGPDLAIEVLSPTNTIAEIEGKIAEYFENGSRLVWVIYPNSQYVLVYRSAQEPDRLLKSSDSLDGEEVVPGFTFVVGNLFQKLSF